MPSKQFSPPLPDVVPERDSRVVRCYAEHLEGLGLSAGKIGEMTSTARHVAVWLAADGLGLDAFDIRLVDRFMRHECRCPGWPQSGRRPGPQRRRFALRFLRYLLETGRAEVPPEIEVGGHLAMLHAPLDRHAFAKRTDRCPYCHLGLIRVGPLIYVRRVARDAELNRSLSRETRYVPGQAKLDGINDATLSDAIGTAEP